MILRFAAAVALVLGVAGLVGFLTILGEGPFASPEMRHLRAMKNRTAKPASLDPMSYAELAALPHQRPLAEYAPLERRAVSLEGYVQRMLRAADGDIHLELAPSSRAPGGRDTAYATAEVTPRWRHGSENWQYEAIAAAFQPNHGSTTSWEGGPRRARVSGWLLYDFQYDGVPTREALASGAPRLTGWEIHPVTRIELWDDSLARFVEYRR